MIGNGQDIITSLPAGFLESFHDEIMGTIPAEKVKADLRQAEIGRVLVNEGGQAIEGIGQKLGEVDPRTYFRWLHDKPGCWDDKQFVHEFFRDNPKMKSEGWTPKKASALRHGVTFVGGKSISNLQTP